MRIEQPPPASKIKLTATTQPTATDVAVAVACCIYNPPPNVTSKKQKAKRAIAIFLNAIQPQAQAARRTPSHAAPLILHCSSSSQGPIPSQKKHQAPLVVTVII